MRCKEGHFFSAGAYLSYVTSKHKVIAKYYMSIKYALLDSK